MSRPQRDRLSKRPLGLLQPIEESQSLTAVESQFEARCAQRLRPLESRKRFLGSIHARQHRPQIVAGETVGGIDLHRPAVGGLGIRQSVLSV
jgi:hypothetical protein